MLERETAQRGEASSGGTSTCHHITFFCCTEDEAAEWLADLREMAASGDADALRLLPRVRRHLELAR